MPETAEVDAVRREGVELRELVGFKKSGGDDWLEVDQVGISREGGKALVGRVAEAGRTKRTRLPIGEPGRLEKI